MSKIKTISKDRELNKALSMSRGKPLKERTKLHTKDIVYWLRKRFQQTNPNMNYLFFPEELQKHQEVENIFQKFDEDKSGKLGLGEFYKMLREANIKIDISDLKKFYEEVDEDHDVALDFREFKNCTLSEEANRHFASMMKKVRDISMNQEEKEEKEGKESPKNEPFEIFENFADIGGEDDGSKEQRKSQYLPRTFGNLLNYITYGNRKREITEFLVDENRPYSQRFEKFQDLYDLKIGKDVYFAKYNEKFNNFRDMKNSRAETLFLKLTSKGNKSIGTGKLETNTQEFLTSPRPVKYDASTENLLKEAQQISKKAQEEAMKEFRQAQLKRINFSQTGVSPRSTSSASSWRGFKKFRIHSPDDFQSQVKITGDIVTPNMLDPSPIANPNPKTLRIKKKLKVSQLKQKEYLTLEDLMKTTEDSVSVRTPKLPFAKNPIVAGDKNSHLYSQLDFQINNKEKRPGSQIGNKHSPMFLLSKYVNDNKAPNNEKVLRQNQETGYSKNLLKTSDPFTSIPNIQNGDECELPDSSDRLVTVAHWNDIISRKQADPHGFLDVKPSKMPLSYSNVSPTFAFYQSTVGTLNSAASTRQTPTVSTDGIFSSPRTAKASAIGSIRKQIQTPAEMSSRGNMNSAGTPYKPSSRSPAVRSNVQTAISEQRSGRPQHANAISVTGLSMSTTFKLNSLKASHSRAQTQAQGKRASGLTSLE